MTPPPGQEISDGYYVVDCGREVGIFSDKYVIFLPHTLNCSHTRVSSVLSTNAISGVPHGHQVKVNTWHDAAVLYNSLWEKGVITRVRM